MWRGNVEGGAYETPFRLGRRSLIRIGAEACQQVGHVAQLLRMLHCKIELLAGVISQIKERSGGCNFRGLPGPQSIARLAWRDILPVCLTQCQCSGFMNQVRATNGVASEQRIQLISTVSDGIIGNVGTHELSQ